MKRSRKKKKTPSSRLVNSDRHSTMVLSLSSVLISHLVPRCSPHPRRLLLSLQVFPNFDRFSMFRILRSVPDPRTGRSILIRIHLSETNSDRSSELSAHQISLGSSLGLFLRAERSSNLCPNSPRTRSSELSAHQILVRTHFGQSLRAERSSNNCSKVIWNPHTPTVFTSIADLSTCLLYRSILRPLRHIWAEPADRIYSERSAHCWLGPVGVRPSQAAPQVSAFPYVIFFKRVAQWIPRLPCRTPPLPRGSLPSSGQGPVRFFARFTYQASPGGFQRELCASAKQPLRSLSWCHPTLLSLRYMTATLRRSLPLQGPSSGRSVAYRVSSRIPLLTTRLAASGMASSSIKSSSRKVKEDTRGERESSADALSCLFGLFLVPCWPSCRPDKCRQSSLHMCTYAVQYAVGGSRSLSRSFQRGWKTPDVDIG